MHLRPALALLLSLLICAVAQAQLPDRLVDASWLAAHLDQPNLVIVDVRDSQAYTTGHIPGAISMPLTRTHARTPTEDRIASGRDIARLFGTAGIGNADQVVIYDNGSFIDAARALWVFEVYGHRAVALLDGGMPRWRQQGFSLQRESVVRPPTRFVTRTDPGRLATRVSTLLALDDPAVQLVDARSREEFAGEESRSRRAGHIPGAINIPSSDNYEMVDGVPRLKTRASLQALYSALDRDKRVIAYCNKGRDAALTHFVLRQLGYDVAAYDGGWYEWGNRDDTPVVLPPLR